MQYDITMPMQYTLHTPYYIGIYYYCDQCSYKATRQTYVNKHKQVKHGVNVQRFSSDQGYIFNIL